MAVYTDINCDELEQFLKSYTVGEAVSLKGISEGVENSNFYLQTDKDQFILTIYEKRVNPQDLPYYLGLMEHLNKHNIHCPLPVKNKQNQHITLLKNKPAALITFLQGVWKKESDANDCFQLGQTMAKMHLAAENYNPKIENALSFNGWVTLYDKIKGQCNLIDENLEQLIINEIYFLSQNWHNLHLPKGHIHADLFPDNVFFLHDNLSGVIDFYFSCYDFLAYDLIIAFNAWCFNHNFELDFDKAKALFDGYQSVRVLEESEIAALPILARGAALRFLLTRTHDKIFHDPQALVIPKNPLEYAAKLKFNHSFDFETVCLKRSTMYLKKIL